MTVTFISAIFVQCGFFAAKYATFTSEKLQLFKKVRLTSDQLLSELITSSWAQQSRKTIKSGVEEAFFINDIEKSTFYLSFMTNPKKHTEKKIQNLLYGKMNYTEYLEKKREKMDEEDVEEFCVLDKWLKKGNLIKINIR